jgi:dCTP deaminase
MILSDREIRSALERGAIWITPVPALGAFSSTAVDLTLAEELRVWKADAVPTRERIRPGVPNFNLVQVLERLTQPLRIGVDGYEVPAGALVLGWTVERVKLPHRSRLAARVEGKSSMGRLGLGVHVTAPTIHAGFGDKEGDPDYPGTVLQLEIWNINRVPIVLDAGLPICQLIFEEVHGTPEKGYAGRFAIQGPHAGPPPPTSPPATAKKRRRR